MNFEDLMKAKVSEADKITDGFLPLSGRFNSELTEAMNYSVKAGGKRLRPVIMMSFYRLFGGSGKVVEPFMAAMEMLHTYSLVHDDLPAIDNDDYRRGVYTTHKKYGEALAVLAGDGLLHQAYETAVKAFDYEADNDNVIKALRIFADKTGVNGMLGGQAADVVNTGKIIDDDLMYYIYEHKTGALIEGSMMIGAALAGADDYCIETVRKTGSLIGLAFQIKDDLLDIYGSEKALGKPVNSDSRNNKKTYVTVNGKDKSQADILRFTEEAVSLLDTVGGNEEERIFLRQLFKYLTSRNS